MSYHSLPTSKLFQLTALTLSLALAGCGGGDGTDTIAPAPDLGVEQPDGDNGDDGGTEEPIGALNISSSQLVDVDDNTITSIGLEGAYYEVVVTDDNGQPLANTKVTFSIDAPGVDLSQTTSGATLTNSDGEARIFLKPNAPDVSGAYVITANASNDDNTAISNLTFLVQATNVNLSALQITDLQLTAGGQTAVSLKTTDTSGNAISGVLVNLNAACGQLPEQVTSDENGMIDFVYKAINVDNTLCSGAVRISASTGSVTQSASVSIQAPEATSIVYTANDLTLGIQGSGSSATGAVEFTVFSNTTPLANSEVILSLEKSPLGLTFGVLGNNQQFTARTDENGQVSVNIYPGTTPGPVEIKATLASDTRINALSKGISIASSRVTQDGISLSFGKNVLDWSLDGDSTPVVARLVDRNGNAVPDGTVVNFTAEGGKVSPASCNTADGECEVTFSTQNPRPGDGRVSLLAVAEGEKAYIDQNENNAWDEGDIFVHNIGDTFRDDNENGTFEIGEFTYPLTTQADQTCENNVGQFIQLKFPSSSEQIKEAFENNFIDNFVSPNKPMTCNTELDAIIRYERIQLLSSGNNPTFTLLNNIGIPLQSQIITEGDTRVNIRINSGGFYELNPMPSGTTISGSVVDKTDGEDSGSCEVEMIGGPEEVPAIVSPGSPGDNTGTINTYALDQCEAGDFFRVSVTSPNNVTTAVTYTIVN
ncbi:Ig-like domain-containing protein [Psychrobacter sp. T6-6]|uniref:Ig-like domain-containing protein n=1 Tax=Psychrobacter sp. T6-6 TaxID=3457452 RepID=UPI003FD089EA